MTSLYLKHKPQLIINLCVLLGRDAFGMSLIGLLIVRQYKGLVMTDLYYGCVCIYDGTVELVIYTCEFTMLILLLDVNECMCVPVCLFLFQ